MSCFLLECPIYIHIRSSCQVIHSFIHSFIKSLIHSFIHLFILIFIYSCTLSIDQLLALSLPVSTIHSFIHSSLPSRTLNIWWCHNLVKETRRKKIKQFQTQHLVAKVPYLSPTSSILKHLLKSEHLNLNPRTEKASCFAWATSFKADSTNFIFHPSPSFFVNSRERKFQKL